MYNSYNENGVITVPNVLAKGGTAKVRYNGLLSNSGAESIYMHIGYGSDWKNTDNLKMIRTADGFESELPITSQELLHIAFKDSANNWDNNSGANYNFEIEDR